MPSETTTQDESIYNPFSLSEKRSIFSLEVMFSIFNFLSLPEVAKLALVSSEARFIASSYFAYIVSIEPKMREELIFQKQKSITATNQYIRSLENHRIYPVKSSLILSVFMLAAYFHAASFFPPENKTKLGITFLMLTLFVIGSMCFNESHGYKQDDKIIELSTKHKREYLQLPDDAREKHSITVSSYSSIHFSSDNTQFRDDVKISRFISTLHEIIGDLKAELKALEQCPATFNLLDPNKSPWEQDPETMLNVSSYFTDLPSKDDARIPKTLYY